MSSRLCFQKESRLRREPRADANHPDNCVVASKPFV
jgi:hypothetical protein